MSCEGLRVLLVEDDEGSRRMVARFLEDSGFPVTAVPDAEEAERILAREPHAVVIADYKLPGKDGIELIRAIRSRPGAPPCILITAHGDVESAVAAMRAGAFHFLEKPVSPERLEEVVRQACDRERMAIEIERLRRELDEKYGFQNLLGISKPMREVYEKVKLIAPTNSTVLIEGESGTGKELLARAIHHASGRRHGPFVPVNCAALPESLVESELFGHERGAFTGALAAKKGYFEVAEGGTLLIDEVGEVPQGIQPKLLRALENRVIARVGSTREIPIDVRIVAATNRSLERAVREGTFRDDLYWRLAVLKIVLPPLREREGDIPILTAAFIRQFAAEHNRRVRDIAPDALAALEAYPWPGNVRELRNVIESAIVLTMKEVIELEDLPPHIRQGRHPAVVRAPEGAPPPPANRSLAEVEKETILRTLEACGGNRTKAAQILGIGVRTIQRKLSEYGMR